jgi:hypothetical protein
VAVELFRWLTAELAATLDFPTRDDSCLLPGLPHCPEIQADFTLHVRITCYLITLLPDHLITPLPDPLKIKEHLCEHRLLS